MDTARLEVFREVARLGSFTAAGRALDFTQSAVSRQISVLEQELGAPLFDRLPRGVRLTEAGRTLLPHAEAVVDRLHRARRDLRALRDLTAGRLRLSAFPTANVALVPRALTAFRAARPGIALSLGETLTAGVLDGLRAGDLDLGLISDFAGRAPDTEGVELTRLLDDPMRVAVPADHPLAGRADVRLAELAAETWIAGGARPEDTLMNALLGTGLRPEIGYVIKEWAGKFGLVAAGLGLTLVPRLAVPAARPDVALLALHPADTPARAVYTAVPRGVAPSPAVEEFRAHLVRTAAALP